MATHLTRRQVLHGAALGALSALLPAQLRAFDGMLKVVRSDRILVLLEFEGGNDGLNMLVPYDDATYKQKRTSLKLTTTATDWRAQAIPLATWSGSATLAGAMTGGVHAGLDKLKDAWQAGDLAFVHGVGYANPNGSHFRGIDIWNSGADDNQPNIGTGWLGRMLASETVPGSQANTAAVIFRRENNNPAKISGISTISMSKPADFISRSDAAKIPLPSPAQLSAATGKPAVLHLLNTQKAANEAHDSFQNAVGTAPTFTTVFPNGSLGDQVKYVAQCIAGGLPCAFYKISIGGFDNHTNQLNKHADLMAQVADAMRALRAAMIEKNKWDNVLVMSYSEFGRRIEENGSSGTDHGTSAPHFFLGGKVTGGVYGTQPSLAAPDSRGNLVANTDFRRLYATCGKWLGISDTNLTAALDPFTVSPAVPVTYAPITCVDWT
jgi:uncharacterized protein (DUF1501 family)